jgi:hypothetical protein
LAQAHSGNIRQSNILPKEIKMSSRRVIRALSLMIFFHQAVLPANSQGMAESVGMQGSAAGLGSGLGVGVFKVFGSQGSSSSSSSGKGEHRTLLPTIAPTDKEVTSQIQSLSGTAEAQSSAGDLQASAKTWHEIGHLREKHFGKLDKGAADAYQHSGSILLKTNAYSQAEDEFKTALGFCKRINGDNSPKSLPILVDLADSLKAQDRASESITYYQQALSTQQKLKNESPKSLFAIRRGLGEAYFKTANYKDAESELKQSIDLNARYNLYHQSDLAALLTTYASVLKQNGKVEESATVLSSIEPNKGQGDGTESSKSLTESKAMTPPAEAHH